MYSAISDKLTYPLGIGTLTVTLHDALLVTSNVSVLLVVYDFSIVPLGVAKLLIVAAIVLGAVLVVCDVPALALTAATIVLTPL